MTAHVDPIPKEARAFQGRRAGLVTRAAAACIDVGVVVIALIVAYTGFVVVVFLVPPGGFEMPVPPLWLDLVAGPGVMILYLAVSWRSDGRTYGCHVLGVRVVDRQGRDPNIVTALLRAAFNVAFPLGFAWVVVSRQNRSIQDVALRTSVIYDWDVRPRVRAAYPAVANNTIEPVQAAGPTGSAPVPHE
jgi:uncharacterized RDD family membrane protein YckC